MPEDYGSCTPDQSTLAQSSGWLWSLFLSQRSAMESRLEFMIVLSQCWVTDVGRPRLVLALDSRPGILSGAQGCCHWALPLCWTQGPALSTRALALAHRASWPIRSQRLDPSGWRRLHLAANHRPPWVRGQRRRLLWLAMPGPEEGSLPGLRRWSRARPLRLRQHRGRH
jgi:hypothetical protein